MVDKTDSTESLKIASSTVSSDGMARVVQKHYDISQIVECYLLQKGYNDVYILECADQSQWIARLSGVRPRGPGNIDYEVSMLDHLSAQGVGVAEAVRPRSGNAGVEVQLSEGPRSLVLFYFLDYDDPETLEDWGLTGSGLATIHNASEGYRGPSSRYTLDIDHLLRTPIDLLLQVPRLEASHGELFKKLASAIESDLQALGDLGWVGCHGDCHGGNNFIRVSSSGERDTVFFDFDDSGPGYQAYDLAVFLWDQLGGDRSLDENALNNWNRFLEGYTHVRDLAPVDREAIPVFVRMRHLLWLSERAGRRDQWGISALPRSRLVKQVELLEFWRDELLKYL